MEDAYNLSNKVAIVMGGSTGIGAATARLLAKRGAKVVVAGLGKEPLDQTVNGIVSNGGTAIGILTDVAQEDEVVALIDKTIATFGGLHCVHGNQAVTDPQGMASDGMIADIDMASWDQIMAVNLRGCAVLAKHSIPHLIKAGGGSIVFSGSGRGSQGYLEYSAYGASKAGLEGLSRYVATQYGKQGIRSNVVAIGLVVTDAVKSNVPEPVRSMLLEHHLTPRLGQPEDIARVVAFLLSDEAGYVTGTTIAVDGGLNCHTASYADQMRMMASMQQA